VAKEMSRTDKRIEQLIKTKKGADDGSQNMGMRIAVNKGSETPLQRLREKWNSDVQLVSSIVRSLNEKLNPLDLEFSHEFRDGYNGVTIGIAVIGCKGPAGAGEINLDTFESGDVRVYFNRKPANQFYLSNANRLIYENIILDFAERYI
jgi:hypothetical protein